MVYTLTNSENRFLLIEFMKEKKHSISEDNSLEKQYNELMDNAMSNSLFYSSTWDKEGDIYKLFNLHDASKYETMLSSYTPIKND